MSQRQSCLQYVLHKVSLPVNDYCGVFGFTVIKTALQELVPSTVFSFQQQDQYHLYPGHFPQSVSLQSVIYLQLYPKGQSLVHTQCTMSQAAHAINFDQIWQKSQVRGFFGQNIRLQIATKRWSTQ